MRMLWQTGQETCLLGEGLLDADRGNREAVGLCLHGEPLSTKSVLMASHIKWLRKENNSEYISYQLRQQFS